MRPPDDSDPRWPQLGAELCRKIKPRGTTTTKLTGLKLGASRNNKGSNTSVALTNALAWLENNGFVAYHRTKRLWYLTSSGKRLARRVA